MSLSPLSRPRSRQMTWLRPPRASPGMPLRSFAALGSYRCKQNEEPSRDRFQPRRLPALPALRAVAPGERRVLAALPRALRDIGGRVAGGGASEPAGGGFGARDPPPGRDGQAEGQPRGHAARGGGLHHQGGQSARPAPGRAVAHAEGPRADRHAGPDRRRLPGRASPGAGRRGRKTSWQVDGARRRRWTGDRAIRVRRCRRPPRAQRVDPELSQRAGPFAAVVGVEDDGRVGIDRQPGVLLQLALRAAPAPSRNSPSAVRVASGPGRRGRCRRGCRGSRSSRSRVDRSVPGCRRSRRSAARTRAPPSTGPPKCTPIARRCLARWRSRAGRADRRE